MDIIHSFDWKIFQLFETYLWNPVLDVIMTVITTLGDGGIIWIACAICLLISKKYRKVGIMVSVGLIFSLIFTDAVFKPIFHRVRPFNFDGWPSEFIFPELVSKPSSLSFPSGHTSSSFAAAIPMLLGCKKRIGIPAIILAFLIAVSRIYVHVHYPTDVIFGVVFGAVYGIAAYFVVIKLVPIISEKIKAKKAASNE